MAVNPFFKDYKGEQDLVDELTIETIQATGRDMLYIPREFVNLDELFGEDVQNKFKNAYSIEMYIKNIYDFDGQNDVVSKFGINITNRITLVVSKTRFKQEVTRRHANILFPRSGDLIYFPLSDSLFEINEVDAKDPFYQFGKLTTFTLFCELFTYNNETIDTGWPGLDRIETDRKQYAIKMLVGITAQDSNYKTYKLGENAYQVAGISGATGQFNNATAYGVVLDYVLGTTYNTLYLGNVEGTFNTGTNETIIGQTTNAVHSIINTSISNVVLEIDPQTGATASKDNDLIQKSSLSIFDFTETDPFSEGKY
jgi:hypothetical protein